MPSPIGHGLAGLSAAWVAQAICRTPGLPAWTARGLLAAAVGLALAPDLDLLVARHRGPSHSVGATLIVAAVSAAVASRRRLPAGVVVTACSLAYGSHVLLDWLGRDTSDPAGLMVLWPVSQSHFSSCLELFRDISRRYWIPAEFVYGNLRAVGRELIVLGPVATAAWWWKTRRRGRGVRPLPGV